MTEEDGVGWMGGLMERGLGDYFMGSKLTRDLITVRRTQIVHWLREFALRPVPTNHIAELLTMHLNYSRTAAQ